MNNRNNHKKTVAVVCMMKMWKFFCEDHNLINKWDRTAISKDGEVLYYQVSTRVSGQGLLVDEAQSYGPLTDEHRACIDMIRKYCLNTKPE